jgi:hypothetical protein
MLSNRGNSSNKVDVPRPSQNSPSQAQPATAGRAGQKSDVFSELSELNSTSNSTYFCRISHQILFCCIFIIMLLNWLLGRFLCLFCSKNQPHLTSRPPPPPKHSNTNPYLYQPQIPLSPPCHKKTQIYSVRSNVPEKYARSRTSTSTNNSRTLVTDNRRLRARHVRQRPSATRVRDEAAQHRRAHVDGATTNRRDEQRRHASIDGREPLRIRRRVNSEAEQCTEVHDADVAATSVGSATKQRVRGAAIDGRSQ